MSNLVTVCHARTCSYVKMKVFFHVYVGSSGSVTFTETDVPPRDANNRRYICRIIAKAANGDRVTIWRSLYIGMLTMQLLFVMYHCFALFLLCLCSTSGIVCYGQKCCFFSRFYPYMFMKEQEGFCGASTLH